MVQVDHVSSLEVGCGSSLEVDCVPTGLWFNQTLVQLDCLIGDQAISSQLRVGEYPSHHVAQLSKASPKTHFQLVRSRSLRIKLAFTTCQKIVISCSKKLVSAFESHSPALVSGDLIWEVDRLFADVRRANFSAERQEITNGGRP